MRGAGVLPSGFPAPPGAPRPQGECAPPVLRGPFPPQIHQQREGRGSCYLSSQAELPPALTSGQPSSGALLLALLGRSALGKRGPHGHIDDPSTFPRGRKSISGTRVLPSAGLLDLRRLHLVGWKRKRHWAERYRRCEPLSLGFLSPWLFTEEATVWTTVPYGCSFGHFVPFCHHQRSHFLHGAPELSKGCQNLPGPGEKGWLHDAKESFYLKLNPTAATFNSLSAGQLQRESYCTWEVRLCEGRVCGVRPGRDPKKSVSVEETKRGPRSRVRGWLGEGLVLCKGWQSCGRQDRQGYPRP